LFRPTLSTTKKKQNAAHLKQSSQSGYQQI
jgi:hypothetical protein